ncbi:hypothetical protein ACFQYP_17920 [Nonomuraea antimicrobica]
MAGSELYERVAALTNLVIMFIFALINWPADWRDLLRRGTTAQGVPACLK